MKRVITSLSLLLLLLCGAYAQDISQYEYWTDDDYASRSVVSSSGGDVSFDVSTASLSAGIHFLNFRAKRNDDVWGNFYRYLYYIPTTPNSVDAGNLRVEYWLDDDLTDVKSVMAGSGDLSLSIDISALTPGVHYFNCTPISDTGERGNSERYLFYVPLSQDQTSVSPVYGYEYWLDDNYAAKNVGQSADGNNTLQVSIDGLTSGVHYFNCRAYNERGEYGCPVRKMFYIPQTKVDNNASIASAEYWLDDDYASKVVVTGSNTQQTFSIDISGLSSGVHYFNYQARDNNGVYGNIIRSMFYIARSDEAADDELMEFECWIDNDTSNKTTGVGFLKDYVISMDISELDNGEHTFNFKAKNMLDQWTDIYSDTFVISDAIYANKLNAVEGTNVEMVINLKNSEDATAYMFDLVLPDGITVAKNENGKYIDVLSNRHDDHSRTFNYKGENTFSLSTISGSSEPLTGNDGAIRIVTLSVADDLPVGTYTVDIKNASYLTPGGSYVQLPDTKAVITVDDYVLGDVNGNKNVDIGDAVTIVNYLIGKPLTNFVEKAADTNKNGKVDIGDAVTIVNFLVGKTATLSRTIGVELDEREPQ